MKTFISEYYDHMMDKRKAVILVDEIGYSVELWEDGKLIETRDLRGHTQQYAQDCAENWVEGIIK